MAKELTLKNVRMAFPALFEAKAMNEGKPKFSAAFLFEKGSQAYKDVLAAQLEVAKEKWGAKTDVVMKGLNATPDKLALKNGDTKAEYAGYEGMFFVNTSNASRPTVVDRDKTPLTAADGRPYGGCYVNAIVEVWAQDNTFGKRINVSLKGVQFFRDGDAFSGGGVASADQFDEVEEGAETADSLE